MSDFKVLFIYPNQRAESLVPPAIGIFSRLSKRDKKNKYLKLIPYAWELIENRVKNNNKFNDLKKILEENFPKKIRHYEN